MPTTILDGETYEQAYARRFAEEAADFERMAPTQRAFTVTVKTAAGTEQINVIAFTTCDAITRAIDILFDGDQPMPVDGLVISAAPFVSLAA